MTGTVKTTTKPVEPSQKIDDYDRYITQQIERTQFQVKLNEIGIAALTLLIMVIAFLLVMTLVDHWIVDLGFWGRALSMAAISISLIVFFAARCVPFLVKSINPIYAAKTIEQATPSAKNSLINFLLLRTKPDGVKPVVYEAVQRRAAIDLTDSVSGATVDRSLLIRLGYVLAALVCFAGLYKVFSPKDPVTTVSRIVTPWKEIARPSKVQIIEIQPGDTTIYRGLSLPVSAHIEGLGADQVPRLVYSTSDGTTIDFEKEFKPTAESGHFVVELGGVDGLHRDTTYQVYAGDAVSQDYSIDVIEAPNIVVQQIEYTYPAYTQQAKVTTDSGDISAIEGTKITVRAKANQPIESAYIELLTSTASQVDLDNSKAVRTLRMDHRESEAWGSFTLSLLPDRSASSLVAYRVRFSNKDGQKNPEPIEHTIRVQPDLAPLVEMLTPTERDMELHENRALEFEVRAVDPDFELSSLKLQAVHGGVTMVNTELLDGRTSGQVVRKFRFFPRNLGFFNGDIVLVSALAKDNRHANSAPAPNETRTANYRIRVIEPKEKVGPDKEEEDPTPSSGDPNQEGGDDGEASDAEGSGVGERTDGESTSEEESQHGTGGTNGASDQDASSNNESTNQEDGAGRSDESADSDPTDGAEGRASDENDSNRENGSERDPTDETKDGDSAENSPADSDTPVESDGTNDGDAFERIIDHMREQGKDPEDAESRQPQDDGEDDSNRGGDDRSSKPSEPSDAEQERPQDSNSIDQDSGTPSERQSPEGEPINGENPSNDEDSSNGSRNEDDQRSQGENGTERKQDDAEKKDGQQNQNRNADEPSQNDDAARREKSDDGTPQSSEDDGSNQSDDSAIDREPRDSAGANERTDSERSDRQEQASDDSESDPDGNLNETNSNSTEDAAKPSDSDERKENGSPSKNRNEPKPSENSQNNPNDGRDPRTPSDRGPRDPSSTNHRVGERSNADAGQGAQGSSEEFETEDPNLEYARKATDMALEHLRDQQDNRDLLDKLGWTREEAQEFLKRWEKMRNQADESTPKAKKRGALDDVLKSLGLRPKSQGARAINVDKDQSPRAISDGQRSKPPADYAEQYRAYLKESSGDE